MSTATIKERPILFSSPMVRAILDGRKTQTRRIIKTQPSDTAEEVFGWFGEDAPSNLRVAERGVYERSKSGLRFVAKCPYGKTEDRLWVRETWVEILHTSPASDEPIEVTNGDRLIEHATRNPDGGWYYDGRVVCYRATSDIEFCDGDGFSADSGMADSDDIPKWKPSIHMPRWASRITLEITGVRVERLQDISEADAIAEGIESRDDLYRFRNYALDGSWCISAIDSYRSLWGSINGPGSWDANPFVWVVEFAKVNGGDA